MALSPFEVKKRKLDVAIDRLIQAEINDSWKGGGNPDDIPFIEAELELAEMALKLTIYEVLGGAE